jgi:signal transduction histidine kinase
VAFYVAALNVSICALAVALLLFRRRSVLDYWVLVATFAMLTELALNASFNIERFSLGFYAGRVFSLVTSTVVLVVLLSETARLYTYLARANMALQRERNNKLMSLEAMAASISHEVKQPLAAIVTTGEAAKRFLERAPPDLEEVRSALDAMVNDSQRAGEILDNTRALFGSAAQRYGPVDVNEMVLGTLRDLCPQLKEHRIAIRTEFTLEPPLVMGHRGQLQEVMLNLLRNAIEAMDAVEDGSRVLRVKTEHYDRDAIRVAVKDSGPGIDPTKLDGIFEAFVTTKPQGMGLGLAICRMIIEGHGGQLTASSDGGALFQFTLPIISAKSSSTASR